ncbi:MAG: tetratricopeptide repeat protein [Christensenellales bacterium]
MCVTAAMTALFIAMGEAAFSIFIIVLGLWITWLASLYKAMREHQAMLDVLYQEMDAPRFIQLYRTKLDKAKPGSAFEAAMRAHIGNAYMIMGEYAEALEWFTAACDQPDVKLLMAENRAACLQRMDAKELPEALETWKRCMQQVKPARKRRSEQSLEWWKSAGRWHRGARTNTCSWRFRRRPELPTNAVIAFPCTCCLPKSMCSAVLRMRHVENWRILPH